VAVLLAAPVHRSLGSRGGAAGACLDRRLAFVVAVAPPGLSGLPDPDLPRGIQGDLLLLSQGLLSLLLRHAAGLRRRPDPAGPLQGRDVALDLPEPAPLRPVLRHP